MRLVRHFMLGGMALLLGVFAQTHLGDAAQPFKFDVVTDLAYYNGPDFSAQKHTLDVFKPRGLSQAPVLVFVYGGAWQEGDKLYYPYIGRTFAQAGFVTVVVNYRLTPQVQHPGHVEDVARAFAWVVNHIAEHGGNPDNIFLTGHSAGGHLVSLLALNERFLQAHSLTAAAIRGVIPISGVFDVTNPQDGLNPVFTSDPETRRDASPIAHVGADALPFLLIVAEFDIAALIPQANNMLATLRERGRHAELLTVPGKDHTTIVGHIGQDGDITTQAIIQFVHSHTAGAMP